MNKGRKIRIQPVVWNLLLFGDLFDEWIQLDDVHALWNRVDIRRAERKPMGENHGATASHDQLNLAASSILTEGQLDQLVEPGKRSFHDFGGKRSHFSILT